eukprot:gnl/TRDRNA2_/TRDRNA2_200290_c0_seq1.p1 gnl/TRDRNA2_/TRDRNA2_200290_c0~~gnl/TRDRNA2_/TRDRNA2_200290_c0_seq1.p1  ORF type:complete len:472 (-),score=66.53 gnl/TRDRNA2_/TRDRNA2_200290_c0_seq1:47-1417(-)
MWWNVGPHLERRCEFERGEGKKALVSQVKHSYFSRTRNTDEFCEVLIAKYGSVSRAWRTALDADNSGLLDFREFVAALKQVGYHGNLRSLWYNLDTDQSGYISLYELDPAAARAFDKFRVRCTKRYGTIHEVWDKLIDDDHSGTVALREFVEAVAALDYGEHEARDLFELLRVRPGARSITFADIEFLQEWEDRKKDLLFNKASLPLAWVNKDPHFNPGARDAPPPQALRAGTMFHLLDDDGLKRVSQLPSYITDDEEDWANQVGPDQESEAEGFKRFLIERYGNLCDAFDAMDMNHNAKLDVSEFQTVVAGTMRYCRASDSRRLFKRFVHDGMFMTWKELGISSYDWTRHTMAQKLARIERDNAKRAFFTARPGEGPRARSAEQTHRRKMTIKPANEFAFGRPLPTGWGFPPSYDPFCDKPPPPQTREERLKMPLSKRHSLVGERISLYESGKGG